MLTVDGAVSFTQHLHEVPGFLGEADAELFMHLSETQHRRSTRGDLLEIGAWYGRSAILMGFLAEDDEQLHVCDLFEQPPPTGAGRAELEQGGGVVPSRADFEAGYKRFHADLPIIHQGPSTELSPLKLGSAFRFVHIDGSHLYESMLGDIALTCSILAEDGIVVFDDFVNFHHLGVGAAVWSSVLQGEFTPFGCTPGKLYATVDERAAVAYRAAVETFAEDAENDVRHTAVAGSTIVVTQHRQPGLRERAIRRMKRALPGFGFGVICSYAGPLSFAVAV
ncbi:MAG: class I SAM-dependent methyltransferase [Gaiellaceae bacterium]